MFFSLNKKFFFTVSFFFILIAGIFMVIFDGIVGKKIRKEHNDIISRNQYVIELLNENIALKRQINYFEDEAELLVQKQEELSKERRLNDELIQNYNENYASLVESLRIISIGAALTLAALLILWFLLRRWVVMPLDRLTLLLTAVTNGDFSQRFKVKKGHVTDEFDVLMSTINFMLDNIENNINEIKQNEIFLQSLLDALPDAVRIIDENYNILLSNKAYTDHIKQKYFYDAEKCYLSYNKHAVCPCSSSQYVCPISEFKKTKAVNAKLIHSVNNRPLSINSARIMFNGQFAVVESIRDLSENIHYSHQQKISSLAFLATSLAHEMKNNLGAINIILTGLLEKYHAKEKKPTEEKKYLEMISNQIVDCIQVPERLLKISRDTGAVNGEFDIVNSIDDVLSLYDYEIKRRGIVVTKSFAVASAKISGNETDFKMIVINLVQNAIHAMPEGGSLSVTVKAVGSNFVVLVEDSGCGIAPKAIRHIFEPFYSVATSGSKKGTGLGLAIVKDLVTNFRAKINVKSKEKVGTCFKITIPYKKSQKKLVK